MKKADLSMQLKLSMGAIDTIGDSIDIIDGIDRYRV